MALPPSDTPLYNHPLPDIEQWLVNQGCVQDKVELHCWHIERPSWNAELLLDVDQLIVRYFNFDRSQYAGEEQNQPTVQRSFKYSLSRKDIEDAVFAGP